MRVNTSVAFVVLCLCTGFPAHAYDTDGPEVVAAGDLITARHRYRMGDNDTKSDASAICFLEAKR